MHRLYLTGIRTGSLPAIHTEEAECSEEAEEIEDPDEHVQKCLSDIKKAGARTASAGWFPKSFSQLLASCDIEADVAHTIALRIRTAIAKGVDDSVARTKRSSTQPPTTQGDRRMDHRGIRKEGGTRNRNRIIPHSRRNTCKTTQDKKRVADELEKMNIALKKGRRYAL